MSRTKILSLALLGLIVTAPAFAQDTVTPVPAPTGNGYEGRGELHKDIHQDRQDMKTDVQNKDYKAAAGEKKDIRGDKKDVRKDRRGHQRRVGRRSAQ